MEKELKQQKWLWDNFNTFEIMIISIPPCVCAICFMLQCLYRKAGEPTTLEETLLIVGCILFLCAVLFLNFAPSNLSDTTYNSNLHAQWRAEKDEMLFLGAAIGSLSLAIFQILDYEWLRIAFPTINPVTCVMIKIGSAIIAVYIMLLLGIRYRCLSEGIQ